MRYMKCQVCRRKRCGVMRKRAGVYSPPGTFYADGWGNMRQPPSPREDCSKNRHKASVGLNSVQKHLKILDQRQLIEVRKPKKGSDHQSDDYYPLSLDNPEIYRDIVAGEIEELPLYIGAS